MPLTHVIYIRCYGSINVFLKKPQRAKRFAYFIKGCPSIKDTMEAIGVPHTSIDVLCANNKSQNFHYQIKDGDYIEAFPHDFSFKKPVHHLTPKLKNLRFIVDSHLGKLARNLRLLGFDVLYENNFEDEEIVSLAFKQERIVLTRDVGLLKHKKLNWGYWVSHIQSARQIQEVFKKYKLWKHTKSFTRCLECNGLIEHVSKNEISHALPLKVKKHYRSFYRCNNCQQIYWKGSHFVKLTRFIQRIKSLNKN